MLIMELCKENSPSVAGDDSEEEEDIFEGAQSPRINVTDNEEEKEESGEKEMLKGNESIPGRAPVLGSETSLNAHLLACLGTLPDTTNAQAELGDLKQLESDKKAVYSHPLFPLLALLFEKCEMATRSINSFDSDPSLSAFNNEIEEFIEHQQKNAKPLFTDTPEVDSLMIRSIQVFRIHLLELEKVSELCKDFCHRYISCLRSKMRSDVLLRGVGSSNSGETKGEEGAPEGSNGQPLDIGSAFLSSSASSLSSASPAPSSMSCSSPSRSLNGSPPSSPSLSASSVRSSQPTSNPQPSELPNLCRAKSPSPSYVPLNFDQIKPYLRLPASKFSLYNSSLLEHSSTSSPPLDSEDNMVAHDLSVKKTNANDTSKLTKSVHPLLAGNRKVESVPVTVKNGHSKVRKPCEKMGGHSKRGVLPKQATSIMRSWLFQHIVHPYPTEDEKRAIASQTNLTLLQVNNWFINARRRILQPMLDSANTIHHDLMAGNVQELDLSSKSKATVNTAHTKKLKTSSQQLNRFWPQSLANIIQTSDLNSKS